MNQKTLIFVSCFTLVFVCTLCLSGFGFIYYLMNKAPATIPPAGGIACTLEAKQCADGSYVGRDPEKNCDFKECPGGTKICTDDVKMCPDGSAVSRDSSNNCVFKECPSTSVSACTQDIKVCPDGSYVSRDSANSCQFKTCN